MNSQEDNISHYEKISGLIICETIALSIFIYLNLHGIPNTSLSRLMVVFMLYLQLPAVNFIAEYLSKRLDKIKKFFVSLAIIGIFALALGVLIIALIYQTLPTLVAIILFGITMWLTFFPPPWFKEWIGKFKKKE